MPSTQIQNPVCLLATRGVTQVPTLCARISISQESSTVAYSRPLSKMKSCPVSLQSLNLENSHVNHSWTDLPGIPAVSLHLFWCLLIAAAAAPSYRTFPAAPHDHTFLVLGFFKFCSNTVIHYATWLPSFFSDRISIFLIPSIFFSLSS